MSIHRRRPVPEVQVPAGAAALERDLLLDVRERDEWDAGHAPGATWIPMGQVERERFTLPMDRRIVVICRSGNRSATVTEALVEWGFDAANLVGGMRAWATAGHPVVRDDGARGDVI